MSVLALNDQDFEWMSAEPPDAAAWTTILSIGGSGFLGLLAGFIFKSGALRAEVTALALRVTAVEAGNSKIGEKLELTATKEDMRDGFAEVKLQARDAELKQQARDAEIKLEVRDLKLALQENNRVNRLHGG